jgi:hypothetical protein
MAKRIIILERIGEPSDLSFNYALWADVPLARQPFYANPEAVSAYKGATAEELNAIKAGQIVEQVGSANFLAGTPLSTIKSYLQNKFAEFQQEITARNPWVRYGSYWDGTSWTEGGIS